MDASGSGGERLVLLVDSDVDTRFVIQPLLRPYGLELVIARAGLAALEVMQRMADRFRLALVSLDLPGLSGKVVFETLRHFRPALPVLCLSGGTEIGTGSCLAKPLQSGDLAGWLSGALDPATARAPNSAPVASAEAVARAQSRYGVTGSLVDAARELARGMPGETAQEW